MIPADRPSPDDVRRILGAVVDPELGADIVTLGMVDGVTVAEDGTVTVGIKLTIGGCPMRAEIKREVETRVALLPGVSDVRIAWGEMTAEERSATMAAARWNAAQHAPETEVPATCRVIAISSGKGGVGKSSVTVNLAVSLAQQGMTVGLLDADIWGFSVPRLLGLGERLAAEVVDGRDKPMIVPHRLSIGSGSIEVVSTGFLVEETTALMWRGLMLNKAVEQFLRDVRWGALDYLLIDMPPGTGDVQMGLARLLPRTDVVVVTTPALAAQRVAARAADMARRSYLRVVGVIENMSSFECDHGQRYALFGAGGGRALADELDVPLLAELPLTTELAAGGDTGVPVATQAGSTDAPPIAAAFTELASRLINEIAPPARSIGCASRMMALVEAAVAEADAG